MITKVAAPKSSGSRFRGVRFAPGSLLIGAMLAGSIGWGGGAMSQERGREHRLEYRLEAVGPATAKSAKVKFTLTNHGRESARILAHNTPLKGAIETKMFAITCNDREDQLQYRGLMRSSNERAEVVQVQGKVQSSEALKDSVLLNPGDSRDATVDLATAYPLPESGLCRVAFTSLLNVVQIDGGFGGQPAYEFVRPQGEPLLLTLEASKD